MKIIVKNADYRNSNLGVSKTDSVISSLDNYMTRLTSKGYTVTSQDEARFLNLASRLDDTGLSSKIKRMYLFVGNENSQSLDFLSDSNNLIYGGDALARDFTPDGFKVKIGYTPATRAYADPSFKIDSLEFAFNIGIKDKGALIGVQDFVGSTGVNAEKVMLISPVNNRYQSITYISSSLSIVTDTAIAKTLTLTHTSLGSQTHIYKNDNDYFTSTASGLGLDIVQPIYIGKVSNSTYNSFDVTYQHFLITDYLTSEEVVLLNGIMNDYNSTR